MHATCQYNTLFLIEYWFVGKSRNLETFSDINHFIWFIFSKIYSLYNSTKNIFGGPSSIPTPRLVSWHPPLDNVIKVNVDGSSIGNPSRSGFRGLLRNSLGGWIIVFAGSYSHNLQIT
jgi:hypothetical protein